MKIVIETDRGPFTRHSITLEDAHAALDNFWLKSHDESISFSRKRDARQGVQYGNGNTQVNVF